MVPLNHPFVHRVWNHYKPSILGYPYFWKHPSYGRNYLFGENAITKCGGPLSVLQVLNMDGVSVLRGPLSYRVVKGGVQGEGFP